MLNFCSSLHIGKLTNYEICWHFDEIKNDFFYTNFKDYSNLHEFIYKKKIKKDFQDGRKIRDDHAKLIV